MTSDPAPLFSVIIPVYRHWPLVYRLLEGLAAQRLSQVSFEVILVNNAPEEPLPPLALPGNARIVDCAAPGAYVARNAGVAAATGAVLVFTDADCRPESDWLAALARASREAPGALLAGPVETVRGDAPPNRYESYDRLRGIPQARYVRNGYAATANLSVPMRVFGALGGFEEDRFSGGDAEFCRRAGRAGHPILFVPDAVVAHAGRTGWEELATKARRVKGGQIKAGPLSRRALWFLRTLTPPLRAADRFRRADAPLGERLAAIRVLFALWFVELGEMARLLAGGMPERR
jgi:hypothetical protein